jgi:poly(A) polymerase
VNRQLTLPESPKARIAADIARRLADAGHETYLVGGCVRSLLLGEEPKDYDIATAAHPEDVQRLFAKTIPIGVAFGVVIVVEEGLHTEVATFRADGRYLDRRRPDSVTFADAQADAARRDFTVNALYLNPQSGEVLDWVGGLTDIEAKLIRAVGDPKARFEEDALRLLRAVRLAARCDFEIESGTWNALRAEVQSIAAVSAERIGDEIAKLFTGPHPGRGLRLLNDSGLLDVMLPEIAAMRGVPQPGKFHPEGDVFVHTALCLDHLPPDPDPALALGVLLHDVGKPPTFEVAPDRIRFSGHDAVGAEIAERICRRLRFSNDLTAQIVELVRRHMQFKDMPHMRPATLKRFLLREDFPLHLDLHRCDVLGSNGEPTIIEFCLQERDRLQQEGLDRLPPPLVTGDDLIALGYSPGPLFREILDAVETEQLEGRLTTPESARKYVTENWNPESM